MRLANADIATLAQDPLRNIVLLKHLEAFPDHTRLHRVTGKAGAAALVLLKTAASPYDRATYPAAELVAMISSDHPDLTAALLEFVPPGKPIVFKLPSEADRDAVAATFPLQQATRFVSFTSDQPHQADDHVRVTRAPDDAAFDLFALQDHPRDWLEPLLQSGQAFACVLERDGQTPAACFAFENHAPVWEIAGVVTRPQSRGRGFGARVVRTALAELAARGLTARYAVREDNAPSIRLAESAGLTRFLTITHFLHLPGTG